MGLAATYRLLPLPGGDVLAVGLHSWRPGSKTTRALSRVYRLDGSSGAVRWRFPADKPLPRNITNAVVSADGKHIACVSFPPRAGQKGGPEDTLDLVILDGKTGQETGKLKLPPLKPTFQSVRSDHAMAMAPSGAALALGASDGRVWSIDLVAVSFPALSEVFPPSAPQIHSL